MAWPLASQFSAMLQRPELAFRDPELKRYTVERDRFRQPRPWAGAFAVVYKGLAPDGKPPRAIRVFTTESPERHDRYDAISSYLQFRRLNCLVEFEYREDSVRASGSAAWYPLIVMDWVQGETLFRWVAARARDGDRQALGMAAARWLDVIAEMEQAGIAHGDLQHANVMVTTEGQLKLVDYDCMCVPALVGRRNLEVGVEPYQHPERNGQTLLNPTLDRFSAMVIYVALRSLAADPGLWIKYVDVPNHDKLLFHRQDFLSPGTSPLVTDLRSLPQHDVVDQVDQLLDLVTKPMAEIPPLGELNRPSFAGIERLLRAANWEGAVDLLNRRGRFLDAPPHIKPLIEEAYQHVCRQEAWVRFCRVPPECNERNERALVKAWNEHLFAGFPWAEAERWRVDQARSRVAALDQIDRLSKHLAAAPSFEGESAIVESAAVVPQGYGCDAAFRIEQARARVAAIQRLQAAAEGNGEAAVAAAWHEAIALECEGLAPAQWRPRINMALRRAPLIQSLQLLPANLPPEQFDQRLLEIWQEELLEGCMDCEPWCEAYRLAKLRRGLLDQLSAAIQSHDDAEIVRLTEHPSLVGYPFPPAWNRAIVMARASAGKTAGLITALRDGDLGAFVRQFDARLIRKYQGRFAPHEALLCRWTNSQIVRLDRIGLGLAVGRASLWCADRARGVYRVTWTWPQQRYSDSCVLAICPSEPGPDDDPRTLDASYRQAIDRPGWESGGGSRLIQTDPEWAGGHVVVWSMVDIGFRVFSSHPLVLGCLGRPAGFKLWRLFRSACVSPAKQSSGVPAISNDSAVPGASSTDSGPSADVEVTGGPPAARGGQ